MSFNSIEIYNPLVLKTSINVEAQYLNKNLNTTIYDILCKKVSNKCNNDGFVKADSIKIIKRGLLTKKNNILDGTMQVDVEYEALICCPYKGTIIECKVISITSGSIMAINGPLNINIIKKIETRKEVDFNSIKINDIIKIKVITYKFSLNDITIQVIGEMFINAIKKNKKNNIITNVLKDSLPQNIELEQQEEDDVDEEYDDEEENEENDEEEDINADAFELSEDEEEDDDEDDEDDDDDEDEDDEDDI